MSEPELTEMQVLAGKDFIPAYFDEDTGDWFVAQRFPDGDAGWANDWYIWNETKNDWLLIDEEDVPQSIIELVEGY